MMKMTVSHCVALFLGTDAWGAAAFAEPSSSDTQFFHCILFLITIFYDFSFSTLFFFISFFKKLFCRLRYFIYFSRHFSLFPYLLSWKTYAIFAYHLYIFLSSIFSFRYQNLLSFLFFFASTGICDFILTSRYYE